MLTPWRDNLTPQPPVLGTSIKTAVTSEDVLFKIEGPNFSEQEAHAAKQEFGT